MPGKLICVDQIISAQPGLVLQSSGCLTASRIWTCNVFLDVYSGYGYGFVMRDTSLDQTIAAKRTFKCELSKHNVNVKAYCANNRRFTDLRFKEEVMKCN